MLALSKDSAQSVRMHRQMRLRSVLSYFQRNWHFQAKCFSLPSEKGLLGVWAHNNGARSLLSGYTPFFGKGYLCRRINETITKTCLYHFDPSKPHFYIGKLGFTWVYIIFLIFAQIVDLGYTLEPPRRGGSNEYPQSMFWAEIWKK